MSPRKYNSPRANYRPPLVVIANVLELTVILCLISIPVWLIGGMVVGSPAGFMGALGGIGAAITSVIAWTVVYIARTLDDIGYAVGAPAETLPMPSERVAGR